MVSQVVLPALEVDFEGGGGGSARGGGVPPFFAIACFFAITLENYKLC